VHGKSNSLSGWVGLGGCLNHGGNIVPEKRNFKKNHKKPCLKHGKFMESTSIPNPGNLRINLKKQLTFSNDQQSESFFGPRKARKARRGLPPTTHFLTTNHTKRHEN